MSLQRQLRKKMGEMFSKEELRGIAFDLSINFDDLLGEALTGKINGLLVAAYRLGKLESLHQILTEERPDAGWPSLAEIEEVEWPQLVEMVELPPSVMERVNQMGSVGEGAQVAQGDGIEMQG